MASAIPIGPLIREHRLIRRVVADLELHLERLPAEGALDPEYVDVIVDFIRTYADRCHHGKEEGILFRDLAHKPLEATLAGIMAELIQEHAHARVAAERLAQSNAGYRKGDQAAVVGVLEAARELVLLYPVHIDKEEQRFFKPVMTYLTEEERAGMIREFSMFDETLIHQKYGSLVEELEAARGFVPPGSAGGRHRGR